MLVAILASAALVAGIAGTWSPCGMSMIETISVMDRERARGGPALACVALSVGCVMGAIALFCGLALGGALLWDGGHGPALAAALAATAAAVLDACGVRVLPQIRRQVPEPWRRRLPFWQACGAYGVLLGMGFTTFVMSYTLWAAAILSLLVASPAAGAVVGAAFGLGRALPIALLAPRADRDWAVAVQDRMMQRPVTLRIVRVVAATLIGACAATVAFAAPAAEAKPGGRIVAHGVDPSVDGGKLAYRKTAPGARAMRLRDLGSSQVRELPGERIAVGGGLRAKLRERTVTLLRGSDALTVGSLAVPEGTSGLAVSDRWLAYTVPADASAGRGFDQLFVRRVDGSGEPRLVISLPAPAQVGRPALWHDRLAYHVASAKHSRIDILDLAGGSRRSISRRGSQLLFPSLRGEHVAFVQVTACRQRLLLRRVAGSTVRVLAARYTRVRRDSGFGRGARPVSRTPDACHGPRHKRAGSRMYWQTALGEHEAFLTIVDAAKPDEARILQVPR